MTKATLRLSIALVALGAGIGCSEDAGDSNPAGAGSGSRLEAGTGMTSAGTTATGAGTSGGAGAHAGAGHAGSMAAPQGSAGKAGSGSAGKAGSGSGSAFTEVGVCGQRGMGTVKADSFVGYEEFYIIGEEGFGDDICVVRFDVKRVGAGPEGCDDPAADVDCLWTHEIEYSNPSIVTDMNGVCAKSDLGFDADKIAETEGTRTAYGFVSEYVGHNSVILQYDKAMSKWVANGNATWDEDTGAFRFDRRDGTCNY